MITYFNILADLTQLAADHVIIEQQTNNAFGMHAYVPPVQLHSWGSHPSQLTYSPLLFPTQSLGSLTTVADALDNAWIKLLKKRSLSREWLYAMPMPLSTTFYNFRCVSPSSIPTMLSSVRWPIRWPELTFHLSCQVSCIQISFRCPICPCGQTQTFT